MTTTTAEPLDWAAWLNQRMADLGLIPRTLASQIGRGERVVKSWRSTTGQLPPSTVHEILAGALAVPVSEVRVRWANEKKKRRAAHAPGSTPVGAA